MIRSNYVSTSLDIVRGESTSTVELEAVYRNPARSRSYYEPDDRPAIEDVRAFDIFGHEVQLTDEEWERAMDALYEVIE